MPPSSATAEYLDTEPSRQEVDRMPGATMLEFGTPWCGYCMSIRPLVQARVADYPQVRHLRVEDGPGRPLGRSYGVKLWPTFVFLRDGREVARLVRPRDPAALGHALQKVTQS
jgi:thioredoxin 1